MQNHIREKEKVKDPHIKKCKEENEKLENELKDLQSRNKELSYQIETLQFLQQLQQFDNLEQIEETDISKDIQLLKDKNIVLSDELMKQQQLCKSLEEQLLNLDQECEEIHDYAQEQFKLEHLRKTYDVLLVENHKLSSDLNSINIHDQSREKYFGN